MRTRSEILALLGLTACSAFRPEPEINALYGGPPTRPEIVVEPSAKDTDEPEAPTERPQEIPAAIYGGPPTAPDEPTPQQISAPPPQMEVNDIYGAPRTTDDDDTPVVPRPR